MIYDFNECLERDRSEKWVYDSVINGCKVLPMGVADMDLVSPVEVREALDKVIRQREFGYPAYHEDFNKVLADWFSHYYDYRPDNSAITEIPGLITTLGQLVKNLCDPQDKAVLMPPVYHCFKSSLNANNRGVIESDLKKDSNNYYTIDFEKLERDLNLKEAKFLIFCNPHNPVGRCWTEAEVREVVRLCQKTNTILISDEIHGDFTFDGLSYTPVFKAAERTDGIIMLSSGGKIFNIGGIFSAFSITYDKRLQQAVNDIIHSFHYQPTAFAHEAAYAGYKFGHDYRSQLLSHIRKMQLKLCEGFRAFNLPVTASLPEATYLVWADFNPTGWDPDEIHRFLYQDAALGFNRGDSFGLSGAGFARINCAVPEAYIDEALRRLKKAFELKGRGSL